MTIEEAIKHCEEVSRRSPCTPCERDHMQLAGWLSELVSLRAQQEQPDVVHGRWEIIEVYGKTARYRCTACKTEMVDHIDREGYHRYCHKCGAKMDGGEKDAAD